MIENVPPELLRLLPGDIRDEIERAIRHIQGAFHIAEMIDPEARKLVREILFRQFDAGAEDELPGTGL